ncbi:gamma-glutamylcyclotransferase family protein [Promethearchaeum syntrophicum]|uniref:Gamma-glutamylcyclotransferase family protein n=1 Tax=Promethearchaeum syntrophicum TaxID=2594042 RepID=A0A5B9D906_9ARCH|nr:gamma-glutamylcyclotransferase family protein [Candidatus Prometheoarchaeum syntrophicum]QEE15501.1 hypothetical protein DSAG12_01327 [Candidatus Prometheoarchaeum syntrophicum]
MINKEENEQNVDLIVGYGTFITNKMFKFSKDVKICFVPKCRRIYVNTEHFPFALDDPSNDGFFALLFRVEHNEFKRLDFYEGVDAGLFYRKKIPILVKKDLNYVKKQAYIYLPTEKSISDHNLSLECDKEDKWIEKIRENPDVCEKFPELLEKNGNIIPNIKSLN